jgi:hypothetical protein
MVCRYDEHGRILEKEHAGDRPEAQQLFSYRYDPLGRLECIVRHSAQEDERVVESMQYAADGTKTKTLYPAHLYGTQTKTLGVAAEAMLHMSIDAVVIMTLLDASGRPIRKVLYDVDDRVIHRVAFRYDASGLLLEEGQLVGGFIRDDFRNVYRYDALGRQVEVDQRWGDLGGHRRVYSYNERGDRVQEISEQNEGLTWEDSGLRTWTQRFAYQYDDLENWIERTVETISHTGETRVNMIERRELSYY